MTTAGRGEAEAEFAARAAPLIAQGAEIEQVPASVEGSTAPEGEGASRIGLSLTDVLDRLGRREVNELWVEAGPRLAGALLHQRLIDELIVYVAPKLLGPQARPLIEMGELRNLQDAPHFHVVDSRQIGQDVRLRLRPVTMGES